VDKTRNSAPSVAWTNPNSKRYQVIVVILVCIVAGGVFLYYSNRLWWNEPELGLIDLVNGAAPKPYIYRVLIPFTVRMLISIFPGVAVKLTASLIMFLALVGFVFSLRYLVKAFWRISIPIDIAVLLSPFALAPLMIVANHIYDFGILFLFTLGLALLAHGRFKWFVVLFPFICLAKETAVLLTIFFAIFYVRRLNWRTYLSTLFFQGFIYVTIKVALTFTFRDNPGGNIAYHVSEWLLALSISPVLLISFYGVLGIVIAILVVFYWKDKPLFLRYSVVVIVPILIFLHAIFGIPYELRVFYEVFPALYLLSIFTIFRFIGIGLDARAKFPNAPA